MSAQPAAPVATPDSITADQVRQAITAGANCEEIFALRNGMHPKDPALDAINDELRAIGCYRRSSTRTAGAA